MKKLIATIALTAVVVGSSYAQGLVFFNNQNSTKVSTNGAVGGAALGVTAAAGGAFYYALFYSTTQTAVGGSTSAFAGTNGAYAFNSSGWSDAGLMATNSGATAGRFASNTGDAGNNSITTGLAGVVNAQFVVIGWSANLGTEAQMEAYVLGTQNPLNQLLGWFGESAVSGTITTGNGGTQVTPQLFGVSAPQIGGFTVGEVVATPEPGTLALAALGGASLLMFRRKNK